MRLIIDQHRCTGNTICVAVAPELIEMGEDDKAHVIKDEEVGVEYRMQVLEAVSMCPTQAITVDYS